MSPPWGRCNLVLFFSCLFQRWHRCIFRAAFAPTKPCSYYSVWCKREKGSSQPYRHFQRLRIISPCIKSSMIFLVLTRLAWACRGSVRPVLSLVERWELWRIEILLPWRWGNTPVKIDTSVIVQKVDEMIMGLLKYWECDTWCLAIIYVSVHCTLYDPKSHPYNKYRFFTSGFHMALTRFGSLRSRASVMALWLSLGSSQCCRRYKSTW